MNFIQPGLQDVMSGRFLPDVSLLISSVPSSMMVRSAAKFVSRTASKPSRLKAACILPLTSDPDRHAELFAEHDPDRRGFLDHDKFIGIVERFPDLFRCASFIQCAHGAMDNALAAIDADAVAKARIERGRDQRLGAPVIDGKGIDRLDIGADLEAPAAEYAFVRVAHDRYA